jgi:hypothetical protein
MLRSVPPDHIGMTASVYAQYRKLPPSCVLSLPKEERDGAECSCEGTPHTEDWAKLRRLSYGEKLDMLSLIDRSRAQGICFLIARGVVEWNLLDTSARLAAPIAGAKGEALAISEQNAYALDEETAEYISDLIDEIDTPRRGGAEQNGAGPPVPNRSGGRSRKR